MTLPHERMNSERIGKILQPKCKPYFLGVFASDRLPARLPPRRPLLLVCNTDKHDRPGEHWVVIYLGTRRGEYFDSYGQPPIPLFERYLTKFCSRWIFNDKKIQSFMTEFCGHYCIFYCLYKRLGYSLKSIADCFTEDETLNDFMVHKFVCDLISM